MKIENSSKRGFTLIELLVVIAIIGILSSVVLAALSSARNKGVDASIKSTMNNAPAAAQLWFDFTQNGVNWNGVCSGPLNSIRLRLIEISGVGNASCNGTGQNGWLLYAQLKETTGYWCTDYLGTKKVCNSQPSASTYTCAVGC